METKPSYGYPLSGRMMRSRALLLAALLGLSNMAQANIFADGEARKRIDALLQENNQLKQQIGTMQSRMSTMQAALDTLEQKSKLQLSLVAQMDVLKDQISKLTGQDEVLGYSVDMTSKRQKDLYADLDARLRDLEKGRTGTTAAKTSRPDVATELTAYNAAFELVQAGNFKPAISALDAFIKQYPDSSYAANAQYWIGNSQAALGDQKAAAESHRKLLSIYPQSDKVPDAMLNLAQALDELGDKGEAGKLMKELVAKHPTSNAARQAKPLLKKLQ